MAAAFTESEREQIRSALRSAAMSHARVVGMKRTSVDELCADVGISKGAFYHFYGSKELLFLNMLEERYQEIAAKVVSLCRNQNEMTKDNQAAEMFLEAIRLFEADGLIRFVHEDVPLLLRRIPQNVMTEHYQSMEDFILRLMKKCGFHLRVPETEAVDILRILFMSLLFAGEIGEGYGRALNTLVHCACARIIKNTPSLCDSTT